MAANLAESLLQPPDDAEIPEHFRNMREEAWELDLPPYMTEACMTLFQRTGLPGDEIAGLPGEISMADYCGPCHQLAGLACMALVVSELVGVLLGWKTDLPIWLIVLMLQLFNVIVLWLQWQCLKYVLLPWQHLLYMSGSATFSLPIALNFFCLWKTGFDEGKLGISLLSLVSVGTLQNQAVHMGKMMQHYMDFHHRCISGSCFAFTFVGLFWVIVNSQPVQRGGVRWDFDRDRSMRANEEIRFHTILNFLRLTREKTTHYEASLRYGTFVGMFGIEQMTNSLQEAEMSLLAHETDDYAGKRISRLQMIMRFNCALVLCRVLFRTVPQVCLSTWHYHDHWQSWGQLLPLIANLVVLVFSDGTTTFNAERIYVEFESDEGDFTSPEQERTLTSARMYRVLRWLLLGFSLLLVLFCLCLVVADWICQPFLVSDFTCSLHQHQGAAILFIVCPIFLWMVIVAVSVWYFSEPFPLGNPRPRKIQTKLYVDEDAAKYYFHNLSQPQDVKSASMSGQRFEHKGQDEAYGSKLMVEPRVPGGDGPFVDDHLLRVQERGQQNDIARFTWKRRHFLLTEAKERDWFELALRFGKELTPQQWQKEVRKHPERRMVKLLGFDGRKPMLSGSISQATNQLLDEAHVVLWDGDWVCMQGWTGMIYSFLNANKKNIAVAFQKKAEVPGFHRSYWNLYQKFPNRIRIVVLKDLGAYKVCPKRIHDQHKWLEMQFQKGLLERTARPEEGKPDTFKDYLTVAMFGRIFQSLNSTAATSVIAMNGGHIATAQAALETGPCPFRNVHWTVYEAWTVQKPNAAKSLVQYALENPSNLLKLVLQEDMPGLVYRPNKCSAHGDQLQEGCPECTEMKVYKSRLQLRVAE